MLLKLIITVFSVSVIAYYVPGVLVTSTWAAIWTSIILGFVNIVIRPFLILFTLPINFLSLGLFSFVINALMVMLVASIVEGFYVDGFVAALIFSVLLSLLTSLLNKFISDKAM